MNARVVFQKPLVVVKECHAASRLKLDLAAIKAAQIGE
jgi:hypothetical protein